MSNEAFEGARIHSFLCVNQNKMDSMDVTCLVQLAPGAHTLFDAASIIQALLDVIRRSAGTPENYRKILTQILEGCPNNITPGMEKEEEPPDFDFEQHWGDET